MPTEPFSSLELAEALARRSPLDFATLIYPDTKRWPHIVLLNEHLLALTEYRLTAKGPAQPEEVHWFYRPKGAESEEEMLPALSVHHIPDDATAYQGRTPKGPVVFRLAVSMMPRAGKSRIITESFIPWLHLKYPGIKTGLGTYSDEFGRSWGTALRDRLVDMHEMYPFLPQPQNGRKEPAIEQRLTGGGVAYFSGRGGSITGKTLNVRVGDDFIKNSQEADSKTEREKAKKFYRTTWKTRKTAAPQLGLPIPIEVLMGTRWHVDDVIHEAISDDPDGFCVLVIPALCTDPDTDPLNRQYGESHSNAAGLRREELLSMQSTEPQEFACLYQGDPRTEEGNTVPGLTEDNWYTKIPARPGEYLLPDGSTVHEDDCMRLASVDMAATKRTTSDYTVGVIAIYHRERDLLLVLDMFYDRVTTDEYEDTLLPYLRVHGPAVTAGEDITFGKVFGRIMESEGYRFEYHPGGRDKVARMTGSQYPRRVRRGAVLFPRFPSTEAPPLWLTEYTSESSTFPNGTHDDIMDAMAFLNWWTEQIVPKKEKTPEPPRAQSQHQAYHDRMMRDIAKAERETAIANGKRRRTSRTAANRVRWNNVSRVSRRRGR